MVNKEIIIIVIIINECCSLPHVFMAPSHGGRTTHRRPPRLRLLTNARDSITPFRKIFFTLVPPLHNRRLSLHLKHLWLSSVLVKLASELLCWIWFDFKPRSEMPPEHFCSSSPALDSPSKRIFYNTLMFTMAHSANGPPRILIPQMHLSSWDSFLRTHNGGKLLS